MKNFSQKMVITGILGQVISILSVANLLAAPQAAVTNPQPSGFSTQDTQTRQTGAQSKVDNLNDTQTLTTTTTQSDPVIFPSFSVIGVVTTNEGHGYKNEYQFTVSNTSYGNSIICFQKAPIVYTQVFLSTE